MKRAVLPGEPPITPVPSLPAPSKYRWNLGAKTGRAVTRGASERMKAHCGALRNVSRSPKEDRPRMLDFTLDAHMVPPRDPGAYQRLWDWLLQKEKEESEETPKTSTAEG